MAKDKSPADELRRLTEQAIEELGPDLKASGLVEAFANLSLAARYFGPRLDVPTIRMILRQEYAYAHRSHDWMMEPNPDKPGEYRQKKSEAPMCPDSWLIVYHPSLLETFHSLRTAMLHQGTGPDGSVRWKENTALEMLADALALRQIDQNGRPALSVIQRQGRYLINTEKRFFASIVDETDRLVPRKCRSKRDIEDFLKIDDGQKKLSALLAKRDFGDSLRITTPEVASAVFSLRVALRKKHSRERTLKNLATRWLSERTKKRETPLAKRTYSAPPE